jgi:hypothetical protein
VDQCSENGRAWKNRDPGAFFKIQEKTVKFRKNRPKHVEGWGGTMKNQKSEMQLHRSNSPIIH